MKIKTLDVYGCECGREFYTVHNEDPENCPYCTKGEFFHQMEADVASEDLA